MGSNLLLDFWLHRECFVIFQPLCVVIDTNVLLEDLNFLDDLKDQKFKGEASKRLSLN